MVYQVRNARNFRFTQPHLDVSTTCDLGHAVVLLDITVCVSPHIPEYLYTFWIPILAFETLLCGLAVFRGFQNMRVKSSLYYSGKEIVDVLLRDSVIYFIV